MCNGHINFNFYLFQHDIFLFHINICNMKFCAFLSIIYLTHVRSIIENDIWMLELESFIYNTVTNPTEVRGCGDDLIFKMITYNGHLYHVLKKVEHYQTFQISPTKEVFILKKLLSRPQPGPTFLSVPINYTTLKKTYHWTDWDLNTTQRIYVEAQFLWEAAVRTYNSLPPM